MTLKTLTLKTLVFTILLSSFSLCNAQSIATQLPEGTFIAFTASGTNLLEKMPIEYFEGMEVYNEMRKEFLRQNLSGDLNGTGFDMSKEAAFFVSKQGDYILGGFLVPVSNKENVKKLMVSSYDEPLEENGVTYTSGYGDFQGISDNYFAMTFIEVAMTRNYYDEEANAKYEALRSEKKSMHKTLSLKLLTNPAKSLANVSEFKTSYDSDADLNFYLNVEGDLMNLLGSGMGSMFNASSLFLGGAGSGDMKNSESIQLSSQAYFEDDQIRIESNYKPTSDMMDLQMAMSKSKMNKDLLKLVPKDDLMGVWSVNLNMEELLNQTPDMASQMFTNAIMPFKPEFGNGFGPALSELVSLCVDEESLGKLITGTGVVSVSNLSLKQVEYIGYEYDEDYNYIEKISTKEELIPDILMALSTEDEKNMNNILKVISVASEGEFLAKDGYFMLNASRDIPMSFYVFVNDGVLVATNNLNQMNAIKNGSQSFNTNKDLIKNIAKCNQFVHADLKNIFLAVSKNEQPENREGKALLYLSEHTDEINIVQNKPKGDSIQSTVTIKVPKSGHDNGLKYIFNLINDMYLIFD